ncbi:UDP-glucuronosyltransferase 2C1-like isoform X1 [Anguilla rostrata]|uniref:UDP-glucuronosyltransferase 2C1-like isoform X1 n=1 Tax=Anguilla rostrata TaxID=7938 RepID=UPI0030D1862C
MTALPVALLLLLWAGPGCEGGRVLVYPVDGSHWLNMRVLVEALHARGHQVTVLRSSTSWYIAERSPHYTAITVHQEAVQSIESKDTMSHFLHTSLELRKDWSSPLAFLEFYTNLFRLMAQNNRVVAQVARIMFTDGALMRRLREERFDLVLTDPVFPTGVLLAHKLQLPLVLNVRWSLNGEGHFAIAPSPISYIPLLFSHSSDRMDFPQRLSNALYYGLSLYLYYFVSSPPYQAVCREFFSPGVDVFSLIQGADLWLMRVDFVFEFPRPTMPNVVYMGGFQCRPAQPLPSELEEFVQSSGKHGVVLMSLGTLLGGLQPHISDVIASAFARLPQKVVWRHLGARPSTLGNNTLLLDWLPQNDLLGHPKTRAFVTHGGTNGLYEAIYHGVPILGLPLIFDQMDNMVRVEARGAGIVLDVTALEVDSLTQALQDVLDEQKPYRENMRRLSRLHRDQPLEPLDSALFWMEFVMRHGGAAHLRTESYRMPWYAYHNLDVLALLLGSATALLVLIGATCRCLFQRLCRTRKVKRE